MSGDGRVIYRSGNSNCSQLSTPEWWVFKAGVSIFRIGTPRLPDGLVRVGIDPQGSGTSMTLRKFKAEAYEAMPTAPRLFHLGMENRFLPNISVKLDSLLS